jgi:hypothetical protein
LEQRGVDNELVQLAAGAATCVDVGGTEVGDDFDEEFVGEREEGWRGHCGGRVLKQVVVFRV